MERCLTCGRLFTTESRDPEYHCDECTREALESLAASREFWARLEADHAVYAEAGLIGGSNA